jgi:DNA topoisomerase IB
VPGIRLKKAGESFVYLELQGKQVKDEEKLKRIKAVVIPGAWKDRRW